VPGGRSLWDYRNRLTQVVLKNSAGSILQQSDYTYDAFNRRIIKSFDDDGAGPHTATVTKTIYDPVQPPPAHLIARGATELQPDGSYIFDSFVASAYADFDSSNTLIMRYLFGPSVDFLLSRRTNSGTVAWYLADHLGTIRDIANTTGTVLDHINYTAFGPISTESNPSNGDRFKFTARDYDAETGLYFYRARFYDPQTGRFTIVDPVSFSAGDPNLYRYVVNSPVVTADVDGLCGSCLRPDYPTYVIEANTGRIAAQGAAQGSKAGRVLLSKIQGRAGEVAANVGKTKRTIQSIREVGKKRIPDHLDDKIEKLLIEVKYTKYISYTSQLQDDLFYALEKGLWFVIVAKEGTRWSSTLQRLMDIEMVTILPVLR
jgi:RHS repeat-associated protein